MFGQKMFNAHVYMDIMDARVASIHGNRYGEVFAKKITSLMFTQSRRKVIVVMVLVNLSRIMLFLSR